MNETHSIMASFHVYPSYHSGYVKLLLAQCVNVHTYNILDHELIGKGMNILHCKENSTSDSVIACIT